MNLKSSNRIEADSVLFSPFSPNLCMLFVKWLLTAPGMVNHSLWCGYTHVAVPCGVPWGSVEGLEVSATAHVYVFFHLNSIAGVKWLCCAPVLLWVESHPTLHQAGEWLDEWSGFTTPNFWCWFAWKWFSKGYVAPGQLCVSENWPHFKISICIGCSFRLVFDPRKAGLMLGVTGCRLLALAFTCARSPIDGCSVKCGASL